MALHQMFSRPRLCSVVPNRFFFLFLRVRLCEVKYCSSYRFTGATISTSRICFFKRRLTRVTTPAFLFFVAFEKRRKKKKKRERRKTTDNDLSLLRLSLTVIGHETNTAEFDCSCVVVLSLEHRLEQLSMEQGTRDGYRRERFFVSRHSPAMRCQEISACVGN